MNRFSLLLLTYGFFSVLCQVVAILFSVLEFSAKISAQALCLRFAPHLEYPLMSLTLLLGGALLLELLHHKEKGS